MFELRKEKIKEKCFKIVVFLSVSEILKTRQWKDVMAQELVATVAQDMHIILSYLSTE